MRCRQATQSRRANRGAGARRPLEEWASTGCAAATTDSASLVYLGPTPGRNHRTRCDGGHVSAFGPSLARKMARCICWRDGGRDPCRVSGAFPGQEADSSGRFVERAGGRGYTLPTRNVDGIARPTQKGPLPGRAAGAYRPRHGSGHRPAAAVRNRGRRARKGSSRHPRRDPVNPRPGGLKPPLARLNGSCPVRRPPNRLPPIPCRAPPQLMARRETVAPPPRARVCCKP